jgi:hypothetical protein
MKDIFGAYTMLIAPFLQEMAEIKEKQEEHKVQIIAEWEKSKNYPRKKKKIVRKHLQLDWSIANWNPLEF